MSDWVYVEAALPPPHLTVWAWSKPGVAFRACVCYGMHEPFWTFPDGWESASDTAPKWINVTHWRTLRDGDTPESTDA